MAATFERFALPEDGRWLKVVSEEAANSSAKTFTVPDGIAWEVLHVHVELAATATVGTRVVTVAHYNESDDLVAILGVTAFAHVADANMAYDFFPGCVTRNPTSATIAGTEPLSEAHIPAGHKLKVFDSAAIAPSADDMTVQFTVVEHTSSAKASEGTPDEIDNLELWLRADSGVVDAGDAAPDDGEAVKTWTDRHGAIAFTHGTAGARPLYRATGLGGQPSLDFDGSNDQLNGTLAVAEGALTIFVVCSPDDGAGGGFQYLFDALLGRLTLAHNDNGDELSYRDSDFRGTGASQTGEQIITYRLATADGEIYRNGNLLDDGLAHTQVALNGVASVGGQNVTTGEGAPFDGDIAEVIVYSRRLTDAEMNAVLSYLSERYGIGVTLR